MIIFGTINSVAQYLHYLEKYLNGTWNYFYRGENRDYGDTKLTANLYRGYKIPGKSYFKYNTWETYLHASRVFYKNVPHLNNVEYDNFMELCQHHALPTPLLDISLSPLVALYFAVQSDKSNGQIYVFNKNNFIPFSNEIFSYAYLSKCFDNDTFPFDLHKICNIRNIIKSINSFMENANENQLSYIEYLTNNTIKEFINYVNAFYKIFGVTVDKKLIRLLKKHDTYIKLYRYFINRRDGILTEHPSSFNESMKDFLHKIQDINFESHMNIPLYKLISFSNVIGFLIYYANSHYAKADEQFVPSRLNLCVNSMVNWNRIKAQSGRFIVQVPFKLNKKNYNHLFESDNTKINSINTGMSSIVNKPQYCCKFIVSKNKKSMIRRELDSMGINKMNLFMDKDNIAQYIKEKYYV